MISEKDPFPFSDHPEALSAALTAEYRVSASFTFEKVRQNAWISANRLLMLLLPALLRIRLWITVHTRRTNRLCDLIIQTYS